MIHQHARDVIAVHDTQTRRIPENRIAVVA
jgi:hypothetical protein